MHHRKWQRVLKYFSKSFVFCRIGFGVKQNNLFGRLLVLNSFVPHLQPSTAFKVIQSIYRAVYYFLSLEGRNCSASYMYEPPLLNGQLFCSQHFSSHWLWTVKLAEMSWCMGRKQNSMLPLSSNKNIESNFSITRLSLGSLSLSNYSLKNFTLTRISFTNFSWHWQWNSKTAQMLL